MFEPLHQGRTAGRRRRDGVARDRGAPTVEAEHLLLAAPRGATPVARALARRGARPRTASSPRCGRDRAQPRRGRRDRRRAALQPVRRAPRFATSAKLALERSLRARRGARRPPDRDRARRPRRPARGDRDGPARARMRRRRPRRADLACRGGVLAPWPGGRAVATAIAVVSLRAWMLEQSGRSWWGCVRESPRVAGRSRVGARIDHRSTVWRTAQHGDAPRPRSYPARRSRSGRGHRQHAEQHEHGHGDPSSGSEAEKSSSA